MQLFWKSAFLLAENVVKHRHVIDHDFLVGDCDPAVCGDKDRRFIKDVTKYHAGAETIRPVLVPALR